MGADRLTPRARSSALVVEELADELLVYDLERDHAHCLSAEVARVWRACDGTRSAERITADAALDPGVVARALDELAACALLAPEPGCSRRQLTVGLVRGAAVAAAGAPLIRSIVAPTAADAVTPVCRTGLQLGSSCAVACPNCRTCTVVVPGVSYICGN